MACIRWTEKIHMQIQITCTIFLCKYCKGKKEIAYFISKLIAFYCIWRVNDVCATKVSKNFCTPVLKFKLLPCIDFTV